MRSLFLGTILACLAMPAFTAGTSLLIAMQANAPVQLISIRHGLSDWLETATFQNHSDKVITAYKIGWMSISSEGNESVTSGPWMNVPPGISPGAVQPVPAQNIAPAKTAQKMIFFVSEVKFADGTHWTADRNSLDRS